MARSLQPEPAADPAPSPSQGRSARARQAILEAADDLLVEEGFAGMTIEGVAARAGVAKQTIYRWWTSKVQLLMDSLLDDVEDALRPTDTGSIAGDLRQHLRSLADFLAQAPAGAVLCALIGQAQHDPHVAHELRERFLDPRRAQAREILARAAERGEIASALDADAILDMLEGPIYFRALIAARAADRNVIDSLVQRVFPALAAEPDGAPPPAPRRG